MDIGTRKIKELVAQVLSTPPLRVEKLTRWQGKSDARWHIASAQSLKDLYFYTVDNPRIVAWPGSTTDEINIEFVSPCPGDSVCEGVLMYRFGVAGTQGKEVICPHHARRFNDTPEPSVRLFGDTLRADAERRSAVLQEAGVPLMYEGYTIESWKGNDIAARSEAIHLLHTAEQGRSALIEGPAGVGLTSLAVGILRESILGGGASGLYMTLDEYITALRPGLEIDEVMVGRVKRVGVVVLDDAERAPMTEWAFTQLDALIMHRMASRLCTVLVTHGEWKEGAGRAVLDRFNDDKLAVIIRVSGHDLRKEQYNGQR